MEINSTDITRKILFLDIENIARPENIFRTSGKWQRPAGFSSDLAYILCFGYKWLHEPEAKCILKDKKLFKSNPIGDAELMQPIYDVIKEADVVVSWYGAGHDMPFTTARLAASGLYLDRKIPHLDLYKTAKSAFSMSSNRLDAVAEFLGAERKDKISYANWPMTWAGDWDAYKLIADYCEQDVLVLESLYHKMLPLVTNHPNMVKPKSFKEPCGQCTKCGSTNVIKAGFWIANQATYQKYACKNCHSHVKGEKVDRF
jgi:DNA polymerase elongation subunit (family B)